MNSADDDPFSRPRQLEWLASRGLCDPQTGAKYVSRKLLSQEVFAQARKEFERATANYASPYHAGFTLRKPDERHLLNIWPIGFAQTFPMACAWPIPTPTGAIRPTSSL